MFSELINADTFKLKLCIHMMNILYEHYKKHGMDQQMADEKCSIENYSLTSNLINFNLTNIKFSLIIKKTFSSSFSKAK
jgi:hypothetical protein